MLVTTRCLLRCYYRRARLQQHATGGATRSVIYRCATAVAMSSDERLVVHALLSLILSLNRNRIVVCTINRAPTNLTYF